MAIACTEPTPEVADSTDGISFSMAAFTPTANAILVLFTAASDCTATGTVSGGGLFWHPVRSQDYGVSNQSKCSLYWAFTDAAPASCTITWSSPFDAATGIVMICEEWTGADVGNPIRQSVSGRGTGTSPTLTFSSALLTANGYGFAFGSNVNPPTGTPPLTWTEIADTGYADPTSGGAAAFRATGETGTNYSYSTAASASDEWGAIAFEISAAFDGALQPKPVIARAKPAPVGRRTLFCTSSLEPTTWTTFSAANFPKVTLVRPQPVLRANQTRITAGKMFEAVSAENMMMTAKPGRAAPPPGKSQISFLPDMQGPHPAYVRVERPRIAPVRGNTRIVNVDETPLPYPSRWLTLQARAPRPVPLVRSRVTNAFPILPEQPAQVINVAPRLPQARGSVKTLYVPDFPSARLLALPTVTSGTGKAALRPGTARTVLLTEPVSLDVLILPRADVGRAFWWRNNYRPQTRIVWVPQTITTEVVQDDRDSTGVDARAQSSAGGSGYNRSSRGVGTG